MKIYVDADACPVVDQTVSIANEESLSVVLVKSYAHFSSKELSNDVEVVYVDSGADMADFKIMQLAKKDDIVITQDYGLASLCLAKGCTVLHHKGFAYTNKNIDQLLHSRHTSAMARKAGQRTKGPKPLTQEDKEKFSKLLKKSIQAQLVNSN